MRNTIEDRIQLVNDLMLNRHQSVFTLTGIWPKLDFQEHGGLGRLYSTLGWIFGLLHSGVAELEQVGRKASDDFIESIDSLNTNYPNDQLVRLGDDRNLHCFTVTWFRESDETPNYHGGLIYCGPGQRQTWSVSLDNSIWWQIHT